MRTIIILSLQCAIIRVHGQPTLTANELCPTVGATSSFYVVEYIPPGSAEADFTFDTGDIELSDPSIFQVVEPTTTPFPSIFLEATHASTTEGDPDLNYIYDMETTDAFYHVGVKSLMQEIVLVDHEKIRQIPMGYNSLFTDTWSGYGSIQGQSFNREGSTTVSYNGYGELVLPWASYENVGRIEVHQTYTDSFQMTTVAYDIITVAYYASGVNSYILNSAIGTYSVNGGAPTPLFSSSSVLDPQMVDIPESPLMTKDVFVYPNPATDHVNICVEGGFAAGSQLAIVDMLGREVRKMDVASAGRIDELQMDVRGLNSGIYYIRTINASGQNSQIPVQVY